MRGLRRASARLKAFGESVRNMGLKLAGLGAAAAAPLLASAKVFSKVGDDLAKMSARTGLSVETLSELGLAAELSGTNMETLETSIRKMQRTLVDAATGSSTAQEALALLGLTVADLDKLSPERQFKLIATALAKIEDPTIKAAAAMELFGRSGTQLLPMLSGGAAGLEEFQALARKLGLGDLLDQTAKRTVGAAGTFNAAALLGLQAGGATDRIANATERTAKGVEGLRQDVRSNQVVFV